MTRGTFAVLAVVSACAPAASSPAGGTGARVRCEGPPLAAADVKPVLERRCLGCHGSGGEASEDHDFSRLETLVAQRGAMADEVSARAMPPAGSPPLTPDEISTLVRWARCGGR
jgi:cytochrome c5